MKRKVLLSFLALVLATSLAEGSCGSSKKQGAGQSSSNTPTQSATSAAVSATPEEDIDEIITSLVLSRIGPTFKGLPVSSKNIHLGSKHYYTDSSGTSWIGVGVNVVFEDGSESAIGILGKVLGGDWELLSLATGPVGQNLPDDVKKGLGIDY